MAESSDLLFFDTFSHESSEELNLDLVQFPKPVYVAEVRIIPLGARVQGDFPGGLRLGATNPTQFHIDFFVNDLSKPGASTFEALGSLEYCQNGRIHMDCGGTTDQPRQIPTDGLVLRGWYTTITLAVYGSITKSIAEPGAAGGAVREVAPPAPRISTPPAPDSEPSQEWQPLPPPEAYPPAVFPPDTYEPPVSLTAYQPEYYNDQDPPKDPRAYLHSGEPDAWDRRDEKDRVRETSRERDIVSRSREKERLRHSPIGRDGHVRSRSLERARSRDGNSPRYSRSRSRDREREYRSAARDDYRRDSSRSPYRERDRPVSRDKEWDRPPYKRDEYRRHRPPSYDRSRGGSYEKRGSSFEKRAPSYERRAPSYEKRDTSYEKRGSSYEKRGSSYEKRLSPYEKRATSYEKRYDKRAPSYDRKREPSFDSRSRSPGREDPRKRPRTPPLELPRRPHTPEEIILPHREDHRENLSPVDSVLSDDGVMEYDHNGKPVHAKDHFHKGFKNRKIPSTGENDKVHSASHKQSHNYMDASVPLKIDGQSSPAQKISTPLDSPCLGHDDGASMDVEQFEPILSDEDICDDMDAQFGDMDYDAGDDLVLDDILKCYNPFRPDWQKYIPYNKSSVYVTDGTKNVMNLSPAELCELNSDFNKLMEIVTDFKKVEGKYTQKDFLQLSPDAREEWVNICEQLPLLINNIANESDILLRIFNETEVKDASRVDFKSVMTFILNFCRVGLDYDLALSQAQATYKIRHIKCGVRLLEALGSHKHSAAVITRLLKNDIQVFTRLLELYLKDYMALSIKLMILKAIDSCLGSEEAIEYFLTAHICDNFEKSAKADEKIKIKNEYPTVTSLKNGYQMLIIMLNKNPLSRVKFAINALINKINIFELIKKLRECVLNFNITPENYTENGHEISEPEIELIMNSLEEILSVYRKGSFNLSQPRRFLPVSAQFEINKSSANNVLLDFFQIHRLLETCLFLLTCPLTYNYPVITNPVYGIISQLINSHGGLVYMYDNIRTSELIFRCLLQPFTQQNEEDQMMLLQDIGTCSGLQQLGLEMAYKLQCLYYVNAIFDLQNATGDMESELIDKLHSLYCLGFGSIGKLALASVLSMGDNIQCLLNVYEKDIHSKQTEKDIMPIKKKSPAKNYAVDLTVSTVQFSSDVEFLKKYGRRILNVARKYDLFEQSVASNLQEVLPYLKPLEKVNIFSSGDITDLVEVLKSSIEHVTSAPGDLITCLRILKHLGVPEYENKKILTDEYSKIEHFELKFRYIVLQLYSLDGVCHIMAILEKLCNYFEQPSLHAATFVSLHGLHIANIVLPSIELLNKMLTYVIQCRNTHFKDLTPIPVILQTYNLMYSYPTSAVAYKMAQRACREVMETLLAHTQPITENSSVNESIHKSLWTLLCSEIIKYILTAPYTFIPGMLILSEILPLPLPIQTKFTLNDNELSNMVSNRKLWSAHLHTLSPDVTEMIQIICFSACHPVVQLLKRVCIQLSDIASNMSVCVTRAVLDPLISNVCGEADCMPQVIEPANYNVSRLLNFLACLVAHPSIKCSLLHLVRQSSSAAKSDDRSWLAIPIICNILSTSNDLPSHVQSQECAVSIVNSLCDTEITLLTHIDTNTVVKTEVSDEPSESIKSVMNTEVYLTNALPTKEILTLLISATLEYISCEHSSMTLISSILRTYFVITEHDFGFYYFKTCLEKNKKVLFQLLNRIVGGLGKESPECMSTLLELLKVLQAAPEELEAAEGLQFTPRSSTLSAHELADFLGWYKNKEQHPIIFLETFLKEHNEEHLLQTTQQIMSVLRSCEAPPTAVAVSEPPGGSAALAEPLLAQFAGRALWTQGDAQDERLGAAFWLGLVPGQAEEDVAEAEMISCDLSELTRLYLAAGTDLAAEAERLLHLPPAPPRPPAEPPMFRTKRLHVPRDKRPYVSPARGRGTAQQSIGAGAPTPGPAGPGAVRTPVNAFRSRPANTSRPPSLHVDDFLALEGCGAQPTGPTGYNKMPVMNIRGGRGMRSRGITITDRGRFASSTPNSSSMYRRGRGSWSAGGGSGGSAAGEGSPPLPPHFNRTSSQHFQPPMMQHAGNQYGGSGGGWGGGMGRMGRGRGLRHGRPSFPR